MTAYSNTSSLDFRMGSDPESLEPIPVYTLTITVAASDERTLLDLAYDELKAQSILLNGRMLIRGDLTQQEAADFILALHKAAKPKKEQDGSQG